MTIMKKSTAQRQKEFIARQKKNGFKNTRFWLTDEEKEKVKSYIAGLRDGNS